MYHTKDPMQIDPQLGIDPSQPNSDEKTRPGPHAQGELREAVRPHAPINTPAQTSPQPQMHTSIASSTKPIRVPEEGVRLTWQPAKNSRLPRPDGRPAQGGSQTQGTPMIEESGSRRNRNKRHHLPKSHAQKSTTEPVTHLAAGVIGPALLDGRHRICGGIGTARKSIIIPSKPYTS